MNFNPMTLLFLFLDYEFFFLLPVIKMDPYHTLWNAISHP